MREAQRLDRILAPASIGGLRLPHRAVMGSMHLGLEALDDGGAALAAFYAERARGGAALIVTGGWAVSPEAAGGPDYGVVRDPARTDALRRVTEAVHDAGGLIALQLFHAGRYAFGTGHAVVAPSAVPSRFSPEPPVAMDEEEVVGAIEDFGGAADTARELGFDAVEVMASEGYLINQFCSPLTNRRDDDWGGDAERRMRFGLEVLRAVRGAGLPVVYRLSGADLVEGSSSHDEVLAFARALAAEGADALNVGVGWHESRVPTVQAIVPEGMWVALAASIKDAVGDLPVMASNRIHSLEAGDRVLRETRLDFVSMARPFLADPEIVGKTRRGESALVNTCIACNQACIDRSLVGERVSCLVNPRAGFELEFPESVRGGRLESGGRFAVAGGGPAGLEAARALAALGHRVELFEAAGELGGQFRLARTVPGKAVFGETIAAFAAMLERLGVTVHLGRPLGEDDADALADFDGVVVATGVTPRAVDLPGADLPHVVSYPELLLRGEAGPRVAIVGAGGIGVDVAHRLSHRGRDTVARFAREHRVALPGRRRRSDGDAPPPARAVTLLCRGERVGRGIGRSTRWAVLDELRRAGVRSRTGVSYERIAAEGVYVRAADGRRPRLVPADTVVIAAGQEPHDPLSETLARLGVPHRVVGGARGAEGLDAVRAFSEGLRAAHELGAAAPAPAG